MDRDEAIVLLCALMKHADGRVRASEEVVGERLLRERRICVDSLRQDALDAEARAGLGATLMARIRRALPTTEARQDALTAAVDMMWADHEMAPEELVALRQLSAALGVEPMLA